MIRRQPEDSGREDCVEAALVRERYKLVRVLRREDHYVCAEAVDILDREKRSCLLNLYDGPLLRTYLPCFDRLERFPACRGTLLDGERLVTVFDLPVGTPVEQAFHRRDRRDWRERLDYAARLMEQVLNLADVDPAVSCPALLPENVLADERAGRIRLRFAAAPMENVSDRMAAELAAAALKTILPRRFSSPAEELDLLEELDRGACGTVVQLYALWRRYESALRDGYEALERQNALRRWISLARLRVRRALRRKKR